MHPCALSVISPRHATVMGGKHVDWPVGAGFVVAGVCVDRGDRSARMVLISGVIPGACYV